MFDLTPESAISPALPLKPNMLIKSLPNCLRRELDRPLALFISPSLSMNSSGSAFFSSTCWWDGLASCKMLAWESTLKGYCLCPRDLCAPAYAIEELVARLTGAPWLLEVYCLLLEFTPKMRCKRGLRELEFSTELNGSASPALLMIIGLDRS